MNKNMFLGLIAIAIMATSCSVATPGITTDNAVGTKVGVAKKKCYFGICGFNVDLSAATAAKNGGISKIATVDYKAKGGLFSSTYETIVTGE